MVLMTVSLFLSPSKIAFLSKLIFILVLLINQVCTLVHMVLASGQSKNRCEISSGTWQSSHSSLGLKLN